MKKFSIFISIILCGVILIFSYSSWKEKLASAGGPVQQSSVTPPPAEPEEEVEEPSEEPSAIDLESLVVNMDTQVQELFINRKEQGEKIQFLILGSNAIDSGEPGYGELLAGALESAYPGFVETELMSFDGTSEEFIFSNPQLSAGYDVILMEPFTLKNNGIVEIENEHLHIQEIMSILRTEVNDAVMVLHPPQPIYGAQYYLTQVRALEEFADMRDFAYIDHWEQWPATEDLTLKDYLTEDSNPNNTGAETWANALIAYFTGN